MALKSAKTAGRPTLKPDAQLGLIDLRSMLELIGEVVVAEMLSTLAAVGLTRDGTTRITERIEYVVNPDGRSVSVTAPDYYIWVESGRRPYGDGTRGQDGKYVLMNTRPPLLPIIEWMKRKRIAPGQENRVAWAISTVIAQKGIKPRPFVIKAVESASANKIPQVFTFEIDQRLQAEISKALP